MTSPNTPFPWTPSDTQISYEQYQMFYAIDRRLVSTLINSLGRNFLEAINVVAFLLWLERNGLCREAVFKVNGWPNHLIDILADQVAALLEWLKNPVLVWEMRGDISLIQELCSQIVAFVYLHQRRQEILSGTTAIVNEMTERAFRDWFPGVPVDRNVNESVGLGSVGGAVSVPREHVNTNHNGVQIGSASGYAYGPREVESSAGVEVAVGPVDGPQVRNYNHDGAGFEFRGRYVPDPREVRNFNNFGAGYGSTSGGLVYGRSSHDSQELENRNSGRIAAGPVHTPQELQTFIHVPQLPNMNQNAFRFGTLSGLVQGHPVTLNGGGAGGVATVGRLVQVHREPENMNEGGSFGGYFNDLFLNNGPILPGVPFGPRMGYVETNDGNAGNSRRSEMINIREPIPEDELAQLLRGLNVREEEVDVHEDDRTVFLTFSRGYPVTEPEIWGFFTRKFGNFIQAIHFQEVPEGEQPLYARMVARNSSIFPLICDVNIKTSYVINGKHVWAKKFVKKNNAPAPRSSSSTGTANPPPHP